MELQPRHTYLNGDGGTVHIAGPIHGDPQIYWSIEGDWYRQSDGAVYTSYIDRSTGRELREIDPVNSRYLQTDITDRPGEAAWWDGVVTTVARRPLT